MTEPLEPAPPRLTPDVLRTPGIPNDPLAGEQTPAGKSPRLPARLRVILWFLKRAAGAAGVTMPRDMHTTLPGLLGFLAVLASALKAQYDGDASTVPDWNLVIAAAGAAFGLWRAQSKPAKP